MGPLNMTISPSIINVVGVIFRREAMLMIGETIRKYRKIKGLTQPQLCEILHVHQTHISKIEQGKRSPSVALLAEIRRVLDIPLEDIWNGGFPQEDAASHARAASSCQPEGSGAEFSLENAVFSIMAYLAPDQKKKILDYAREQLELQQLRALMKNRHSENK